VTCLWLTLFEAAAHASPSRQATGSPLRVVTKVLEPFVIKEGDSWDGFSIELWQQLALRLNLQYEWMEVETVTDQLQAVEDGTADVAIAGISMTAERENRVDFTHPFFDAGLQIMTTMQSSPSILQNILRYITPALLEILLIGLIFAIVMGHIIWLIERRNNPEFPRRYFRGVLEGIWWLFTVIATGEYPDKESRSLVRRSLTAAWWLVGVALIAQLTGTIASSLTVEQLTSEIGGPADLPGKSIATVTGSTAADYLTEQDLGFIGVARIEEAYDLLEEDEVQAIVFDAPVLLYYAATKGKGKMQVVGPIFKPEKYGIALPAGSSLRKPINEALLSIYQDGTYEALYAKWFGVGR
jgi:ABC-type amino acid transport substrate-binding protein